jgi:hypothetical protein
MATFDQIDSARLIDASKVHIERLRALIDVSRSQARLARVLIDEAQDYMVLIETIEAARIDWLRQNSG